jgi:DNA-binding NarL/FixJ family response regulator
MINLLIADDHQLLIDGIKTALSDVEFIQVAGEVHNGNEVLNVLSASEIDVILMDINMPEMDGLDCTKLVKKSFPVVKVIALSQFDEARFVKRMVKNGASGYLLKDASKQELVQAIQTVYDGKTYFSESLSFNLINFGSKRISKTTLFPNLSEREIEILNFICKEYSSQEIADELYISFHTVETHRANLMVKAGVKNTAGLVRWALENELVD